MTLRFFLLQAHYRSTLDFSNEALQAAEKGLKRLLTASSKINGLFESESTDVDIEAWSNKLFSLMNEDLATPQVIATLFEAAKWINEIDNKRLKINKEDKQLLNEKFNLFVYDILGLQNEGKSNSENIDAVMNLLIEIRAEAKEKKDWNTADKIRDELAKAGIEIMDGKEGSTYRLK